MRITKRVLFTFTIGLLLTNCVFSQNRTYLGLAPIGLLNKGRISLEKEIAPKVSVGAIATYYYTTSWKGMRVDANARFYVTKNQEEYGSNGLYLIGQVGVASFKTPYTLTESGINGSGLYTPRFIDGQTVLGYGAGLGMGYRVALNRWFMDFNFKLQYWMLQDRPTIYETTSTYTREYAPFIENGVVYRTVGPGAIFAPSFIVGYIF